VRTGVNRDGSRTLVAIGWRKPYVTFLFFYDAQGTLTRTLAVGEFQLASDIARTLTTDRFGLSLEWISEEQAAKRAQHAYPVYSFLIDTKGNILGRFTGDNSYVSRLSDSYARIWHPGEENSLFSIYSLPSMVLPRESGVPSQQ